MEERGGEKKGGRKERKKGKQKGGRKTSLEGSFSITLEKGCPPPFVLVASNICLGAL